MKLKSLQLENIRSHVKTVILFVKGFNCLVGGLGQGKSTVLYALDFVLFGDPLGRSYDYLLPDQLSLGLQRKVGVARALAMNPDVVFFDELTASFDSHTVHMLANIIRWLKNDLDVTSIIVSGDVSLAYSIADRIAVLKDGKIPETGTPDEVRDSRNPDVTLVTSMT